MNLCTYFDGLYLTRGLALLRSIERHEPEARVWVLALDSTAYDALIALDLGEKVQVLRLAEIETEELLRLKADRSWREYIFTLTAHWTSFVLWVFHLDSVAYIDADCWLMDSLGPLYQEVGEKSVAVIPHRWTPRLVSKLRHSGKYNVGWVYFRNDRLGNVMLQMWQDDGARWQRLNGNEFSDQLYLDRWPAILGPLLHEVQHPGANLAPWSQEQYRYDFRGGKLYIVERPTARRWPVLFYHFHSWHSPQDRVSNGYPLEPAIYQHVYLPYELEVCGERGATHEDLQRAQ